MTNKNIQLCTMKSSELILNADGSIYHLHLLPQDIAPTVILVGDQDRVPMVSKHFDKIDVQKQKREFITHTGWIGTKRISVMSTGIGTDNIDIVLNELDALVNIDFHNRKIKHELTSLNIIRVGTSGSIHPDIAVDEIVVSTMAIGVDNLGSYYHSEKANHPQLPSWSYVTRRHDFNLEEFKAPHHSGITLTCPGFYGPQGRILRSATSYTIPIDDLHKESIEGLYFTNLEMESSAIYLLADALGHKAISFNTILANRLEGTFTLNPRQAVSNLIENVLAWIDRTN